MKKYLFAAALFIVPVVSFASIDINLTYGSKGSEVTELQEFLIDKGLLTGPSSGYFFTQTKKAVIKYQKSVGFKGNGFVGPATRAKINTELDDNASSEVDNVITNPVNGGGSTPTPTTQAIKMVSPYDGTFQPGQTVAISWYDDSAFAGKSAFYNVYIDSGKHNEQDGNIMSANISVPSQVPNVRTINWTVPSNFSGDYRINVTEQDSNLTVKKVSNDASFIVVVPTATQPTQPIQTARPSITVSYPNGGETIQTVSNFFIGWNSSNLIGDVSAFVKFSDGVLCKVGTGPGSLSYLSVNLGTNYQCPGLSRTLTDGQYKVVVYSHNGNTFIDTSITDESDTTFTLKNPSTPTSPSNNISVTSPAGGNYTMGNQISITWDSAVYGANGSKYVYISLLKYTTDQNGVIKTSVASPNDYYTKGGSFAWTIPSNISPGKYAFRVSSRETGVDSVVDYGLSQPFNITAANSGTPSTGTLSATVNADMTDGNVYTGQRNVVGSFNIKNTSSEDVSVSRILMNVANQFNLSNITLYNNGVMFSNTPDSNYSGSGMSYSGGPITISANSKTRIDVYVDVSATAPTTGASSLISALFNGCTGVGKTTGTQFTCNINVIGQTIKIIQDPAYNANGKLNVSLDSSSPSYGLSLAGSTGNTLAVYKLRASNESINLKKFTVRVTSGTGYDLQQLTLWDGGTQIGNSVNNDNGIIRSFNLTNTILISKDSDKILTVKADYLPIGVGQQTGSGDFIGIDVESSQTLGTGATSGTAYTAVGSAPSAGNNIFKSIPSLALDGLNSTGLSDGLLMRFKVTANSSGSIGIAKNTFNITTNNVNVSNVQLFAYTDTGYSTPTVGQGASGQIGSTVQSVNSGTDIVINAVNPIQIYAGQTLYFELRGTVSGISNGSSVVTKLIGDSFQGQKGDFNTVSGWSYFVWSDNANSTSAFSTYNWANGGAVPGFPPTGLVQARAN